MCQKKYELHAANGAKIDICGDVRLTLEQLQGLVGGLIEFADGEWHGCPGRTLCVNEEGLLLGLPLNPHFPRLAGNVVVGVDVETPDDREFQGLPD